jgi:hypothetical protein
LPTSARILDKTGEFIHAMPYRAGSYNDRTPLMLEVRAVGVASVQPEAAFLNKDRDFLAKAEDVLADNWPDKPAARRIWPGCTRRKH